MDTSGCVALGWFPQREGGRIRPLPRCLAMDFKFRNCSDLYFGKKIHGALNIYRKSAAA